MIPHEQSPGPVAAPAEQGAVITPDGHGPGALFRTGEGARACWPVRAVGARIGEHPGANLNNADN